MPRNVVNKQNFLLTEAASFGIDLLLSGAGRAPQSLLRQVDAPNLWPRIVFLEAVREDSAVYLIMPSQFPSSQSISRLNTISNHIMGSTNSPWAFTADVVPQAPEDPLFGLMAAYRRDTSPKKVDLGIGAYRDNNAKPWVLPVVKRVRAAVLKLNSLRPVLMSSTGR